ncbi:MAG: hypothetical protein NT067_04850 [Candidatus Diapherotrites archaeon]|nr:hypothetical protein [Candidatus Diapherotrites archaeon]
MKKIFKMAVASIVIIIAIVLAVNFAYMPKIDFSCSGDSDCIVIDGHNCCGYYPVCANKNSIPNPEYVTFKCSITGESSVCGWTHIDGCKCVNRKCEGYQRQPA